jgi:endoglucanase Acf2
MTFKEQHFSPGDTSHPQGTRRRRTAGAAAVALLVGGTLVATSAPASADIIDVGEGSYTTDRVGPTPEGCDAIVADPRAFVTDDAPETPLPTNDWWSSLAFKKFDCSWSAPLHAHPASYQPSEGGLGISYTTTPTISGTATGVSEYHFPYDEDLLAGVVGLDAGHVAVDGWTDWTVNPIWDDGQQSLRATIGHGLPIAWFEADGGDAELTLAGTPDVWLDEPGRLGLSVGGADYLAVVPADVSWSGSGTTRTAPTDLFAVAVLPDVDANERDALVDAYTAAGRAPVTGTQADYVYDEDDGVVRTTYAIETTPWAGADDAGTVAALYPHQSAYLTGGDPIDPTYVSPRGDLTVLTDIDEFTTATPFGGLLPEVPAVATSSGAGQAKLEALLDELGDPLGQQKADTYWTGKALGRATRIVEIADQLDRTEQRDAALADVREVLTDWFTATPGKVEQVFAYNADWGTLVGYPGSYGSDTELNDHHFHYGYFIAAAATLARFDPQWAADYGPMVDLLIRDANGYDRDETRFPYLRDFDIYAGHDWAAGHGAFAAGNNQESSSEGMNFAGALIQWGEATGDQDVRDAGAYIFATQAAAIDRYWFDVEGTTYPEEFGHPTVGMVWGDGGAYSTWFSAEPEMIQGINTLPITGSHLYLGSSPENVVALYEHMVSVNGGPPTVWQDILWNHLALGDAPRALDLLESSSFTPEEGETPAHTYHWIANLAALGTVATDVRADHPLAVAFDGDGRTYVASNVTSAPITVTFTDGTTVEVPAGRTVATGAHDWSGGSGGGGPTPSPDPSEEPTPDPSEEPTPDPSEEPTPDPSEEPSEEPTPDPGFTGERYLTLDGEDATLAASPGADGWADLAGAQGATRDGTPHRPTTFVATGLTASYTGGDTAFSLAVDGRDVVGLAVQVRVSYDLTGDGTVDRTETYPYFATDPVPGPEAYTSDRGPVTVTGSALDDLDGGTVTVDVWSALGTASPRVATGAASSVSLPFE